MAASVRTWSSVVRAWAKTRYGSTAREKVRRRSNERMSASTRVTWSCSPSAARPSRASASIEGDTSMPTTSTPARAMAVATRPVPTPTSRTGPPVVTASAT